MVDASVDEASKEYWVELSQAGVRLGAGFLLTRCHVLTALHCLQRVTPGNDEVDISFASGETLPGRIYRRSPEADLALIDVPKPGSGPMLPLPDHANTGEAWRSPYRPSSSHAFLSGDVAGAPVAYQCEGGDIIEALQLGCSQPLGDYAGYSGSPIERNATGDTRALLGVLLEQYPEQHSSDQADKRASTVLFAATIMEVFRRFDCFDVSHLLKVLTSPSSDQPEGSKGENRAKQRQDVAVESQIGTASAILEALHEWQKRGLLDEAHVIQLKLRVAKDLIKGGMEGDS